MKIIISLVLFFYPLVSLANPVLDVIAELDIPEEDFEYYWGSSCNPNWQRKIPVTLLKDESLLYFRGIQTGMMAVEKYDSEFAWLTLGEKCEALNNYYFHGNTNIGLISSFIEQDKLFKTQYSHSALDAWSIEKYGAMSMNGKLNERIFKLCQILEKKGLLRIIVKNSTFNGKPSKSYKNKLTADGLVLNKALQRTSR